MQRICKSLVLAALVLCALAPGALAKIHIDSFKGAVYKNTTETDPNEATQAGSSPEIGITEFTLSSDAGGGLALNPGDNVKDIRVDLPPGLISNPEATDKCTQADFGTDSCDPKTQLGTVLVTVGGVDSPVTPVYNLVPTAGHVSDFGFAVGGFVGPTHIIGGVRSTGDYGLFFTISGVNVPLLTRSKLTFWGYPGAHNGSNNHKAFIRLPTVCNGIQNTKLTLTSQNDDTVTLLDPTATGADGCDLVPFAPSIAVLPDTTRRDSAAGTTVNVHVPQDMDPGTPTTTDHLASSHVKDTVVVLPPGMTLNPSAATGLESCSDDQFGQGTANAVACPPASKVGTVSIASPVLSAPLTGSVYLGTPLADNPYRIFVVADGFGISVRLKGRVTPDPATGQLTTTFADTPQVPFTDFTLTFNGGGNSTLATPLACGVAATSSTLTPYSGNAAATPTSSYTVDQDGSGGTCPATTPFNLGFLAGSQSLLAGAFSPFTLNITRDDGQQYLSGLTVRQPPGLLGVIQSVPLCGESLAAQGACPEASRVGTSTVSSGAGSAPFSLSGPVYLSGPYGGGPFGLVIAIRALAGPFDLGTVVVRAAIKVDQTDSHLTIETPTLPTILQGIPLRLRNVNVAIDRANFLFNPTNCDPHAVGATLVSSDGATQEVSSPFQATGCDALPYAPKMTATSRAARRGDPAGLTVNLSQVPGEANTKSVSVKLPPQLGARLSTVSQACAQDTFKADPATCNAGSKVGTVSAVTPLLAEPLGGTVYLAQGAKGQLPTLEAVLQGSGITVDLSGTLNLGNGIQSTFGTVPDVPISSFRLTLPPAASNSALAANGDLCASSLPFNATILGQNGKTVDVKSTVDVAGCTVAITKASVKKRTATLTVRAPGPGTITVTGKGLKKVKKTVTAKGTYKLRTKLTKKGVKALEKKLKAKKKLVVKATAGYAPRKGALAGGEAIKASKASKKLTFKK